MLALVQGKFEPGRQRCLALIAGHLVTRLPEDAFRNNAKELPKSHMAPASLITLA